ncbi:mitochondrial fission factor-like isoform X3 [Polypterus senegalus]|uniref:mitochondrial fission factor-like isoform X3 n=1 Tax=Polypterus senegalus TaxID=55291 RepID=UPI00196351F6|nr:mitochondrial fission factor-like isoform X3 [Polypterus senegalus]
MLIAMAGSVHLMDPEDPAQGSRLRCDLGYTEAINQQMRVPDKLKVAEVPSDDAIEEQEDSSSLSFSMHIPDRLSVAADISCGNFRPSFFTNSSTKCLIPATDLHYPPLLQIHRDQKFTDWNRRNAREVSLRRTQSESTFSKTPLGLCEALKQQQNLRSLKPVNSASIHTTTEPDQNLLSTHRVHHLAKYLWQHALQRLLQAFNQTLAKRYGFPKGTLSENTRHSFSENVRKSNLDSGVAIEQEDVSPVDIIALKRQVTKMTRRLMAVEKQNAKHRHNEIILFSILLSACVFNSWLWLRR